MNREWTAKWIGPQENDKFNPVIYKDFFIDDEVKKATLFIASLGLFEAYINGTRIGNEYLSPYKQDPEKGVPYYEFDITDELNYGPDSEANSLDVFLGSGWEEENTERFALKAEIVIEVEKTEEKAEYLSMEFEEVLVEPGTFSEETKKKEELEDIIDLDELFVDGSEMNDLDNLFNDDLFDEFIDEIIEEKKTNPPVEKTETEEVFDVEELLEEAEPFAEEITEKTAAAEEMGFDISAELISKAGFDENEKENPEEELEAEEEEPVEEELAEESEETVEEAIAGTESAEVIEEEAEEITEELMEEAEEVEEETEEEIETVDEAEIIEETEEATEGIADAVSVAGLAGLAVVAETAVDAETEAAEETEAVEESKSDIRKETEDGTTLPENVIVITTDETWGYYASDIETCGIGKGEVFNRLLWADKDNPDRTVEVLDLDLPLVERYAEPISILEELKAEEIVKNAAGEVFLDFGKPFTGYVSFTSNCPEGSKIVFDFVKDPEEEIGQPGFTYIADGVPEVVSAHFTYFQGRYVKVSGWNGELNPEIFKAIVVLPEEPEVVEEPEEVIAEEELEAILQTGYIETSDENLNRLFDNIFTRQDILFADIDSEEIPDGVTEAVNKFATAACYNMDVKEYIETMLEGQNGKCLVTVPWALYCMYGDKEGLENQYDAMKAYVDESKDEIEGYLKESEEFLPYDEFSDPAFIASANYFEVADIVEKAAKVLGKEEDEATYGKLAADVKSAVLDEYFTPTGRNFLSTQEELVTALRTGMFNNRERLITDLKTNFKENCYQITCGFEETPQLCKTLADNGLEDLAYRFLLDIDNYGWLYGVEESDTTIWTSPDSILEDGTIDKEILEADDSMEYGAVAEFLYAYILGIKPLEPGFQKIELAPVPNSNLVYANGEYQSPVGKIVSGWEVLEDGTIQLHFEIPEGAEAKVILPACEDENIAVQNLAGGVYDFEYMPTKDYIHLFNENSTIGDLLKYQDSIDIIEEIRPELMETIKNADRKVLAEPLDCIENLGIGEEELKEIKEKICQLL